MKTCSQWLDRPFESVVEVRGASECSGANRRCAVGIVGQNLDHPNVEEDLMNQQEDQGEGLPS